MTKPRHVSDPKARSSAAGHPFAVLDDCHRRTLVALERLETLVARLPGGVDTQMRSLAADVVRHFSTTARQHHLDEERHVFPTLATGSGPGIAQAVLRLQQDHSWLEEDWLALAPHLDAIACGQSWYDVEFLREGVEIFAALSREHIALEESCLYPEARARISANAAQAMGREMIERRRAARRAGAGERQRPAS